VTPLPLKRPGTQCVSIVAGRLKRTATTPTATVETVTAIDGTGEPPIACRLLTSNFNFVEPLPESISVNDGDLRIDADFVNSLDELFRDLSNPMEPPGVAATIDGINSVHEDGTLEFGSAGAVETGMITNGLDGIPVSQAVTVQSTRVDQATMTTFTMDGETQTEREFVLTAGTQTPRSSQLYLPSGVTITRLVDLVHGSPDLSVAEMLRSITRDRTDGLRDDCYQVLDLLLRAIVEGRRGLIGFVNGPTACQRMIHHLQNWFASPCLCS
jgi:hypothetical protein